MSDYGYAERQRGTQWWGKSVLLTFVWAGFRLFKSEAL
jgi:hypothetical protein